MAPITGLDLFKKSLIEIGVYSPAEELSAEAAEVCRVKANELFDAWNSDGLMIFTVDFHTFLIKPNIQPLTIGQAAVITKASITAQVATYVAKNHFTAGQLIDIAGCTTGTLNGLGLTVASATPAGFTTANIGADVPLENETNAMAIYSGGDFPNYPISSARPTKIVGANIVLNNVFPNVKNPLNIRDDKWWLNQRVPTVPTTLPTDLYYSPDFPNGEIFLWPLPTFAYGLELETWTDLTELQDLTSPFYMPQGYDQAVTLSLAENLCGPFGKALEPQLEKRAKRARQRLVNQNSIPPRISTRDAGMQASCGKNRSNFNYRTGLTTNN